MHSAIQIITDQRRGCGWRTKKGALYLRGTGVSFGCGRLPIPLVVCPVCGHGYKPCRGWTWVDGDELIAAAPKCLHESQCATCPLGQSHVGRAGLLWIGESFYPRPADFNEEADELGISRRIHNIPTGFRVGETWVFLAHRKAIIEPLEIGKTPVIKRGIFRMFRPDRIEVICDGTEPDDQIEHYLKRGLTPVLVQRAEYTPVPMFPVEEYENA